MAIFRKRIFWGVLLGLLIAGIPAILIIRSTIKDVKTFLEHTYKVERGYVENVPIYEDATDPEKEAKLRTHLLEDHLKAAEKLGVAPVESDKQILALTKEGKLEEVKIGLEEGHYFYNVPKKYRFLTPRTVAGIKTITDRFNENLKKEFAGGPIVKIAISSALRPAAYQKQLRKVNANASFSSSHSYGVSFDIFYEDYYVGFEEPTGSMPADVLIREIRPRIGYLMGDALSRQFRSVLMETLIQLQDEGKLYAILEKRQRCYHVTILE